MLLSWQLQALQDWVLAAEIVVPATKTKRTIPYIISIVNLRTVRDSGAYYFRAAVQFLGLFVACLLRIPEGKSHAY